MDRQAGNATPPAISFPAVARGPLTSTAIGPMPGIPPAPTEPAQNAALIGLARRRVDILFAMLRDQTPDQPRTSAHALAACRKP
jgi:hypothetical protein